MPAQKEPGKLNKPPPQAEFEKLPLHRFCIDEGESALFRIHSSQPNGIPFHPVYFSKLGSTRFDPTNGIGTLCMGKSLAGALMEIFNNRWGALNSGERFLTQTQLTTYWVTRMWLPKVNLVHTSGPHLSKLGTDTQLFAGDYTVSREWALAFMLHPAAVDGICFPSRHNERAQNIALFGRPNLLSWVDNPALEPGLPLKPPNPTALGVNSEPAYGPAVRLGSHPELATALAELEVSIMP